MKRNIKIISWLALIFLAGLANNVRAVNESETVGTNMKNLSATKDDRKSQREDKINEKICDRIASIASRLEAKIGDSGNQSKDRIKSRVKEMEESRVSRDAELDNRRNMRDEDRDNFYNKLETKAGADATKKSAVIKFKVAVEKAIEVRRTSIDQAREIMNRGIDSAISNRDKSMESLKVELKKRTNAAIATAKNSCSQDATSDDLRKVTNNLKEEIKLISKEYKSKVIENKKSQEEIQVLRDDRKLSVKNAIDKFKADMKTAQAEFRLVMGE